MIKHFYLVRQAIVDNQGAIMGYELLYRDSERQANIDNARHATASVIVNVLNQAGLKRVVADALAFINVDGSFLRHDFIESIPHDTFIFELDASDNMDKRTTDQVERLHKKGYSFCLDVDAYAKVEMVKQLLPMLSCIKIDTSRFESEFLSDFVSQFRDKKITFVASKVEEESVYEQYKAAGFDAYQGYFFAKPNIIEDKKLDTKQLVVFKLCNTIQTGASIPEIVAEFEQNPELTLQLLQFINSGAFHFRSRISSIHQVITLLGRNALVQWLMLLLYSKSFNNDLRYQNPLIQMVKQRTEIMVKMLKIIRKDATQAEQSEAYFVGILSLMDTLMQMPLYDVAYEFNISEPIHDALFEKRGFLGDLYRLTLDIENFVTDDIDYFIEKYRVNKKAFEEMMLEVFEKTTQAVETSDLS